jgi:integrase
VVTLGFTPTALNRKDKQNPAIAAFNAEDVLYGDVLANKTNQLKKDKEMNDLKYQLLQLCHHNRDGSYGAQANRRYGLKAIADQLYDLGYKPKSAQSIKPKHIEALVEHWQQNDLSERTIKNRMSWLRWVVQKTNRQNIMFKTNAEYGLTEARPKPQNKSFEVVPEQLDKIKCDYIKSAVMLQAAFGLRREEAIKFKPATSIHGDCIKLKASTCKGGRARSVPITSDYQLMILNEVTKLAGDGSLIPEDKSYIEHLKRYERQTLQVGLRNTHGLRHAYAARRYTALSGLKCPLEGGPNHKMMTPKQRELSRLARLQISKELGHSRISVTVTYLGRF